MIITSSHYRFFSIVFKKIKNYKLVFNKKLFILLLIIVFIRIIIVFYAHNLEGDDGARYLTEAINLKKFGIFSTQNVLNPQPTAHDMPLFPGLIFLLLVLFKSQYIVLKIVSVLNCLFFGLSSFALYKISFLLSNKEKVAFLSVLIYGLFPDSFPYSVFYMPESLFSAFMLFSIYYYVHWLYFFKNKSLIISFALLGFSILVKPISITFFPIYIFIGILYLLAQKTLFKKTPLLMIAVFSFIMVIFPWIYRNYEVFGTAEISSITGANLFNCNYRYMLEDQNVINVDSVLNIKKSIAFNKIDTNHLNCMTESVILRNVAKSEIKNNLYDYTHTVLSRHPRLYAGTGTIALFSIFRDTSAIQYLKQFNTNITSLKNANFFPHFIQLVSWCLLGLLYILFIYGLFILLFEKKYFVLLFIFFSLFYLAIIIGPVVATRYRFVMLPFFSLAASFGMYHFRNLLFRHLLNYK